MTEQELTDATDDQIAQAVLAGTWEGEGDDFHFFRVGPRGSEIGIRMVYSSCPSGDDDPAQPRRWQCVYDVIWDQECGTVPGKRTQIEEARHGAMRYLATMMRGTREYLREKARLQAEAFQAREMSRLEAEAKGKPLN